MIVVNKVVEFSVQPTKETEVHSLTALHPKMSEEQFKAFKQSFLTEVNGVAIGQTTPVVMYRGKICDGFHRHRALIELGIDTIKYVTIANNKTLEEVKAIVDMSEVRRHQSPTQLAIKAYDLYMKVKGTTNKIKQSEAAVSVGVSPDNLAQVFKLVKLGKVDLVIRLREGKKIDTSTDSRFTTYTDSLKAIVASVQAKTKQDELLLEEQNVKDLLLLDGYEPTEEDEQAFALRKLGTEDWSEAKLKVFINRLYKDRATLVT